MLWYMCLSAQLVSFRLGLGRIHLEVFSCFLRFCGLYGLIVVGSLYYFQMVKDFFLFPVSPDKCVRINCGFSTGFLFRAKNEKLIQ